MYQIVGFVKDTKYLDLREEPRAIAFVPQMQDDSPDNYPQFVIHSSISAASAVPAIKEAIMQSAPEAIIDFSMLQTQLRDSILRERLMATLSGFFGFLAVVLATIGLYGVISYTVARRTNEIGIRVALGAQRSDVVGMIMREAGTMLLIGLAVGAVLTLVLARAAASMLYGLKPHDPVTLTARCRRVDDRRRRREFPASPSRRRPRSNGRVTRGIAPSVDFGSFVCCTRVILNRGECMFFRAVCAFALLCSLSMSARTSLAQSSAPQTVTYQRDDRQREICLRDGAAGRAS